MKLTESTLRRIIKEELQKVLNETRTPDHVIDDFKYVKDKNAWPAARESFEKAAKGEVQQWWINQNYPGWKKEDFQKVLNVLDAPR